MAKKISFFFAKGKIKKFLKSLFGTDVTVKEKDDLLTVSCDGGLNDPSIDFNVTVSLWKNGIMNVDLLFSKVEFNADTLIAVNAMNAVALCTWRSYIEDEFFSMEYDAYCVTVPTIEEILNNVFICLADDELKPHLKVIKEHFTA